MLSTILAAATLAVSAPAANPASPPAVGDAAPPLNLEHLLQAPDGTETSWEALNGKVVVLEFWATWCAPCVAAIPHMNELAEHFEANDDVVFISITDEGPDIIEPFLEKKPMKSWVGLDTDDSVGDAYGVTGIPHTVLVDRDGRIAAISYPMAVEAAHLDRMLAGEEPGLASAPASFVNVGAIPADGPEPIFEISIRPGVGAASGSSTGPGRIVVTNQPLRNIVAMAWQTQPTRLDIQAGLPDDNYTVVARTPVQDLDTPRAMMRDALAAAFNLEVATEMRAVDAWILEDAPEDGEKLTAAVGGGSFSSTGLGRIETAGADMTSLASMLEGTLGAPVIDNTELHGRWDFILTWDGADNESLVQNIHQQLGLELRPAKREVEVLVVRSASDESDDSVPGDDSSDR